MRIVQKFGGTSVADLDHIQEAASITAKQWRDGHEIAVVVSAMSGETNRLAALATRISPLCDAREYDAVLATGEQLVASLFALSLQKQGVPARSWTGWQLPIKTSDEHGFARVLDVDITRLVQQLEHDRTCGVVCGFQGLSPQARVTTLGRGGSDCSAVLLAAAIDAELCDIYTDVDGVHSADPRIVEKSRRLDQVDFEEMLELSALGAKVIQIRAVAAARHFGVKLRVCSTFQPEAKGTLIVESNPLYHKRTATHQAPSPCRASSASFNPNSNPDSNPDSNSDSNSNSNSNSDSDSDSDFSSSSPPRANPDRKKQAMKSTTKNADKHVPLSSPMSSSRSSSRSSTTRRAPITESHPVTGIASEKDVAKITLYGLENQPGIAARVFAPLAKAGVVVDMIVQSGAGGNTTNMVFTVPQSTLARVIDILDRQSTLFERFTTDSDVVKLSVVGSGMQSHSGVAWRIFDTLGKCSINVQVISTSEIKVSVLVAAAYLELGVRALHEAFELGN